MVKSIAAARASPPTALTKRAVRTDAGRPESRKTKIQTPVSEGDIPRPCQRSGIQPATV